MNVPENWLLTVLLLRKTFEFPSQEPNCTSGTWIRFTIISYIKVWIKWILYIKPVTVKWNDNQKHEQQWFQSRSLWHVPRHLRAISRSSSTTLGCLWMGLTCAAVCRHIQSKTCPGRGRGCASVWSGGRSRVPVTHLEVPAYFEIRNFVEYVLVRGALFVFSCVPVDEWVSGCMSRVSEWECDLREESLSASWACLHNQYTEIVTELS